MKTNKLILIFSILILCGILFLTCKKTTSDVEPNPNNGDTIVTTALLDTLSNHFEFAGFTKVQGDLPTAPAGGSSLKFNIKDTLRLVPGIYIPVRFLHDKSINVKGVYIQATGKNVSSSFYYKVPELPDVSDVDSISEIMVQYKPVDLTKDLPLTFEVSIIPYDETGQPIDKATVPVKVEKLNDAVNGISTNRMSREKNVTDVCGLTGGYWIWRMSYIPSDNGDGLFRFYNDPYKVWGKKGQEIRGSCCNGYSIYGPCPGEKEPNTSLTFFTYSQYKKETFVFYDQKFTRKTVQATTVPLPDSTDFCNDQIGLVLEHTSNVDYEGNLVITEVNVPDRLRLYYTTRNSMYLAQTSSDPAASGYGNPGGIIHELTCDMLVLIQLDPEGSSMDLYKVYYHAYNGIDEDWFSLH